MTAVALQRVQRHCGICFQSRNATLAIMRAPTAANLDSMCLAFIGFDLWFQSETHRTKDEVQLRRRSDSNDTTWFVALAKEQLAAVTEYGFHGISFRLSYDWSLGDYWRHWIR